MTSDERNAMAHIEVTPKMIEAGIAVVYTFWEPDMDEKRDMVAQIFRAMLAAQEKSLPEGS
ncbi:MAG: hypothetical protein ACREFU_18870 [Acetobacteraceae bacterium]